MQVEASTRRAGIAAIHSVNCFVFSVPDIAEARAELDRLGATYFAMSAGPMTQLFVRDPSGNTIELHEEGSCRCERSRRERP